MIIWYVPRNSRWHYKSLFPITETRTRNLSTYSRDTQLIWLWIAENTGLHMSQAVGVRSFNPSIVEAAAGGSLWWRRTAWWWWVPGQSGLHSETLSSTTTAGLNSKWRWFEHHSWALSVVVPHAEEYVFRTKAAVGSWDAVWDGPASHTLDSICGLGLSFSHYVLRNTSLTKFLVTFTFSHVTPHGFITHSFRSC